MWFPCLRSCDITTLPTLGSSQLTVLGATRNTDGTFLGYLILENESLMRLTPNALNATPVLLQTITNAVDISPTPYGKGGQYVKTADGKQFIGINWSNSMTVYTQFFTVNTQTVNSLMVSPSVPNGIVTTIQQTYGYGPPSNTFAVLGFNSSGPFQDAPSVLNNTITTTISTNQITRNQALQIFINYSNYTNGPTGNGYIVIENNEPFSITTGIESATSFITAQQNGVTCLLAPDGTYLSISVDTNSGTIKSVSTSPVFLQNSTVNSLIINKQGYLTFISNTVPTNYLSYMIDGDPYNSPTVLPALSSTPDTPVTIIPNPCSTCISSGQTLYPYRPIPYKINRIICREKTVDNTGLENYAFTIDCTSGLQNAYIKKYLLGLGAALVSGTQIVDDQISLQQEIIDSNEAISEYQKGYSDGYSKGTQNICAGIQTVSSDSTFSTVVGDVASVLSVASVLL